MNQDIIVEVNFFGISFLCGFGLIFTYDLFRILRRLIPHHTIVIAVQDFVYWVVAGVFLFSMMYRYNNGIIRLFSILGILLGMIFYQYVLSDIWIRLVTRFIKFLFAPAVFIMKKIRKFICFLSKHLKRFGRFIIKQVNKRYLKWNAKYLEKKKVLDAKRKEIHDKKVEKQNAKRKLRIAKKEELQKRKELEKRKRKGQTEEVKKESKPVSKHRGDNIVSLSALKDQEKQEISEKKPKKIHHKKASE